MCKVSENPRDELLSTIKQLYDSIWQIIPHPRADERFRYGCVLYKWLGWQDSVWSGSLSAPTPRTPGSFVHSHSVQRSATATRVLHLTVMGSLSDGGCGAASSSLHCYRVSSLAPQPDPDVTQARCSSRVCPATPDGSPLHTRCLR